MFPEEHIVSLPPTYIDYIVTEYSIVGLLGKTERQRAEALIEGGHPAVQAELRSAPQKRFGALCP